MPDFKSVFLKALLSAITLSILVFFQTKFDAGSCRICAFSGFGSPFSVSQLPCARLAVSAVSHPPAMRRVARDQGRLFVLYLNKCVLISVVVPPQYGCEKHSSKKTAMQSNS